MRDLVLLGAGASVEAGVPAAFEMTEQLTTRVAALHHAEHGPAAHDRDLSAALNFVCSALLLYDGARGASPFQGLDVERVFAAVGLLAERQTLEVSPFVASWHQAVDAWDPPNGQSTGRTYSLLAARMLTEMRGAVATTRKTVSYLRPLVEAASTPSGLTIATLNYDLSIEQVAAVADVPVSTGIAGWADTGRWPLQAGGIHLLKLHGSIDWCWENDRRRDGHLPSRYVVQSDDPGSDARPPVVVFGQRGKLRAEGPFLPMLVEFEERLAEATRLIVIGYSFRDDHVNQVIRRWSYDDHKRHIIVVDPNFPEHPGFRGPNLAFRDALLAYLNPWPGEERPSVEARLTVLRQPASEAIAAIF